MNQQIPHAAEGLVCPLHKVDMSQVCHKCPWWTRVMGKHPQSSEQIDQWFCAIGILPAMMMESAQAARGHAAATESMRNNLVSGVVQAVAAAADSHNRRIINARLPHHS